METLGQRLRALRQQRGLTQKQLAEAIGRPQSSISNYETDEHSPTLEILQDIATALQSSVGWLAGETEGWHDQLFEITGYVKQLEPRDQEEILQMMRVLVVLRLQQQEHARPSGTGPPLLT